MIKFFDLKYLFVFICSASSVAALETEIKFESLYDHASEKLIVDGVSTSYSLGSAGIRVDWKTDQNLLFHASFGLGYLPNYKIGIMHLAAGIWKDGKDMRVDKMIQIEIETLSKNKITKSLRYDN